MHSEIEGNGTGTQTITLLRKYPYCLQCEKELFGRADKKFCDDRCRNIFNNRLKSPKSSLVRDVNKTLRRNRLAIRTLLRGNRSHIYVSKGKLEKYNFMPGLCTGISLLENIIVYFCYEYYYLQKDDDLFIVGEAPKGLTKSISNENLEQTNQKIAVIRALPGYEMLVNTKRMNR